MKIFISWSASPSKEIAQILFARIPLILQYVKPFMSEEIEKGSRGLNVIAEELRGTEFGILCLAPNNVDSTWINFEAGALSKSLEEARVFPILFGMQKYELKGPLNQFQITYPKKDDFLRMIISINNNAGQYSIKEELLKNSFDAIWPLEIVRICPSERLANFYVQHAVAVSVAW